MKTYAISMKNPWSSVRYSMRKGTRLQLTQLRPLDSEPMEEQKHNIRTSQGPMGDKAISQHGDKVDHVACDIPGDNSSEIPLSEIGRISERNERGGPKDHSQSEVAEAQCGFGVPMDGESR
jgi:hypothetical protein